MNSSVIFKAVPDGAVLLSLVDEVYFGLNAVGARVWELLPPVSTTLEELCLTLSRDYPEVPLATLEADVAALLETLTSYGLLQRSDREQSMPAGRAP